MSARSGTKTSETIRSRSSSKPLKITASRHGSETIARELSSKRNATPQDNRPNSSVSSANNSSNNRFNSNRTAEGLSRPNNSSGSSSGRLSSRHASSRQLRYNSS